MLLKNFPLPFHILQKGWTLQAIDLSKTDQAKILASEMGQLPLTTLSAGADESGVAEDRKESAIVKVD